MRINISKAENDNTKNFSGNIGKKHFFLTQFKALRSWVALLITLTGSELHQLDMKLIQNAPFYSVHCICELWVKRPG